MSYDELKIGKLVQTVLKPLIISEATINEVMQMQNLEYSKSTFGIQYPLLLKTSSPVAEKHYYSELFTLYGETYRLCCEWFETATNNDRPYVEKWIREHEADFEKQVTLLPMNGIAIQENQYSDRNDLTIVEIPNGVVYIGPYAFSHCSNLKEVIFPDSVQVIDDCAFAYCSSLEKLKLPENLRLIGRCAFMDCFQLKKVVIPQYVTAIPIYCFDGCKNLEEVKISGELRIIMDYAFHNCESLSLFSLYCCEYIKTICTGAFQGCKNLTFETLDYNVISGAYDVKLGNYHKPKFWGIFDQDVGNNSVMIDARAFDLEQVTIRTFEGTAGATLAQELGLKVEYVKDNR